jgi:hypothetical protein
MLIVTSVQWFWDKPSWHWSYVWAALIVVLPSLIALGVRISPWKENPRPFVDLIAGKDGKWSTSKSGVLLWTGVIWFAFLAILFHTQGEGIESTVLNAEYLVVLGIPAATALAASGITTNKVNQGEIDKPEQEGNGNPISGVAEIVSDDNGRTDLLDFQYFGFNLILLGFFVLQFFDNPGAGLPDLPDTLLGLSGVSAATYVGKKGLTTDVGPTVRSVVPDKAARGAAITVFGVNLATVRDHDVKVTVGGIETTRPEVVIKDTVTELRTKVPREAPLGKTKLVVIAYDGRKTAEQEFEVDDGQEDTGQEAPAGEPGAPAAGVQPGTPAPAAPADAVPAAPAEPAPLPPAPAEDTALEETDQTLQAEPREDPPTSAEDQ